MIEGDEFPTPFLYYCWGILHAAWLPLTTREPTRSQAMPAPLIRLPAGYVHHAHSVLAFTAFTGAFGLACALHYRQVVKNGIAGYVLSSVIPVRARLMIPSFGLIGQMARRMDALRLCDVRSPHSPTPLADSPSRIGDWSPERPFFQILIALTSGPRFLLIFLQWLVTRRKAGDDGLRKKRDDAVVAERGTRGLRAPDWVALVGVARTFTWYALF